MRRRHFEGLVPVCPRCRAQGVGDRSLRLATVLDEREDDVLEGILHCPERACQLEYPIIDGIPLLVPDVQRYVADNLVHLNARDDLSATMASLLGDCAGSGSAFDLARLHVSTYAWDAFAEFDPSEPERDSDGSFLQPGAVNRCLQAGLALLGQPPASPAIDLGCGVGRSSFDLAAHQDGLVLGIDLNLPMLRLARQVLRESRVCYPRRRVGLVYDVHDFPVSFAGAERVDFWACDALCLPFPDASFAHAVGLNLLDCVASPLEMLTGLTRVLRPGATAVLSTPYDWSPAATAPQGWIGGHSQRGEGAGASEPRLRSLLHGGGQVQSVTALNLLGEIEHFPWQARLHDRSIVAYDVHVLALRVETAPVDDPAVT